jgi:hypothetical protein
MDTAKVLLHPKVVHLVLSSSRISLEKPLFNRVYRLEREGHFRQSNRRNSWQVSPAEAPVIPNTSAGAFLYLHSWLSPATIPHPVIRKATWCLHWQSEADSHCYSSNRRINPETRVKNGFNLPFYLKIGLLFKQGRWNGYRSLSRFPDTEPETSYGTGMDGWYSPFLVNRFASSYLREYRYLREKTRFGRMLFRQRPQF